MTAGSCGRMRCAAARRALLLRSRKRRTTRTPIELAAIGLVAFVCVALLGTDAWRSWHAREVQLDATRTATENMARSLVQHAKLTIDEVDLVLSGMVELLRRDSASEDR